MNIKTAAATLGAALIIAGSPVLANAAPLQPSPVRLDSVQIAQYYGPFNHYNPGLVTVGFTNQSPVTITKVVFDLEANGNVIDRITDVGSYAQGKSVKHNFQDIQMAYGQTVAVESVTFADGTSWTNTDELSGRRQAAEIEATPVRPSNFVAQQTN